MHTINSTRTQYLLQLLVHLLAAMLVVYYIGYVDEGIHNAYWIFEPGAWFALVIYGSVYLGAQILVREFFFKGFSPWMKTFLVSLLTPFFLTLLLFWALSQ